MQAKFDPHDYFSCQLSRWDLREYQKYFLCYNFNFRFIANKRK